MIFSHFALEAPPIVASHLAIAPAGTHDAILSEINLTVPEHCHTALVGANGTGKSTLLKTFAGLLQAITGTVTTFGVPARIGNPQICYLAQRSKIDWTFPVSVREMVVSGNYIHKNFFARTNKSDLIKADEALEKLSLSHLAKRNIGELSGGQQQRVLLARALCQSAKLLLLDEPYAGLDTRSRNIMDEILFGKIGKDLTLVMATHDLSDALGHFDMILKIENSTLHTLRACRGHERPPSLNQC